MESVAETAKQQSPLTVSPNNPSFLSPQDLQQTSQPYAQPQPPNMATYFQRPAAPPMAPPAYNSYFNQPKQNPANMQFADQQPSVQVHAPSQALHLGASPDSLAGKFGGNMLALEILRSKLKMIAAYKNWQKRLKEYKDKMTEAARMNPYNRAKLGTAKHVIRKPGKPAANPAKPKAYFKRPRKYQTQKYPRTFPFNPRYQRKPFSPVQGRSNVLLWQQRQQQQQKAAAIRAYRQKMAEYQKRRLNYKRFYVPYGRQQIYQGQYPRSKISRPGIAPQQQANGRPGIAPQQQVKVNAYQAQQQQQAQAAAYQPQPQPQPSPIQSQMPQVQPEAAQQRPVASPQDDQPQPQNVLAQPLAQAQIIQQAPEAQPAQASPIETQTDQAQPHTKASSDPLQAEVTADKAIKKEVEQTNADQSISDLKHDIENAIQDALNNKMNNEAKSADKLDIKEHKKVLDTTASGSGSGESHMSITKGHISDESGSGSNGSGDHSDKKSDKTAGES